MCKKRLLFVISSLGLGGAERMLLTLLAELNTDKAEVDILILTEKGALMSLLPEYVHILKATKEVRFLEAGSAQELLRSFSLRALFYRIRNIMMKSHSTFATNYSYRQKRWEICGGPSLKTLPGAYDVAVAFMHSDPSYFVIDKVSAKRKILWVHNDYDFFKADIAFDRRYFASAECVVTISQKCADILMQKFPDIQEKFIWLPNINSAKVIHKLSEEFYPEEYQTNPVMKILSVGRMTEQKGFDWAIQAAAILKRQGHSFCWFFLGTGELQKRLQELSHELGVDSHVRFLGVHENPYPYIKNADIIAQTSRYEGKSLVLDEAKILCKPIVSTNYQTVGDQIEDGITGILCEMTPESIADNMADLIEHRDKRIHLEDNLKCLNFDSVNEVESYKVLLGL